jgi:DNA-binding protein H-NS
MAFSQANKKRPFMQDLPKYSITQLRDFEIQVIEELKTRHFLSISNALEQILHIAQSAGLSEKDLRAIKAPKMSKQSTVMKYRNPADLTQQWSGRGRQPAWVKAWIASGKNIEEAKT